MDGCVFCVIAAGEVDADLVALRTGRVFVLPALRQHPANHGHALVLPVAHTRNLADAVPGVREEIFTVAAALTEAVGPLYGAEGSMVFQNNVAPDDPLFHLHVHVVPRFPGDQFVMTRAAVAEVPRPERVRQAAGMRAVLAPFARRPGGDMTADCLACDLTAGRRPLPGGLIHRTEFWLVEHCVGPLGLGTLIVKPQRHVTAVADLSPAEAAELGPLLRRASQVAGRLVDAGQVYTCLWSHAGGIPGHLHYVVQPVMRQQMAAYGCYGPRLQVAMFDAGVPPDAGDVARLAENARRLFAGGQ